MDSYQPWPLWSLPSCSGHILECRGLPEPIRLVRFPSTAWRFVPRHQVSFTRLAFLLLVSRPWEGWGGLSPFNRPGGSVSELWFQGNVIPGLCLGSSF